VEQHHRGNEHPKYGIAEASPDHRAVLPFAQAWRGKSWTAIAPDEKSRCHSEDLQHGQWPEDCINAGCFRHHAAYERDENDADRPPESQCSECFADLARWSEMSRLGTGKALDGSATQSVFSKEQHKEAEQHRSANEREQQGRQRQNAEGPDQERLAPANAVRPEADRKLRQTGECGQRRDNADSSVGHSSFTQIERQKRQGEADAGHAEKIRAIQSDSVSQVHDSCSRAGCPLLYLPLLDMCRFPVFSLA